MTTAVFIIVGVLVACAILFGLLFSSWKHMDRVERDARYRRRWLLIGGLFYAVNTVFVVAGVATGQRPVLALLALPVPLLLAWFFLRQAGRVKIPPGGSSGT
jgi:cell division protein FtsW (lipid II flippase)